MKTVIVKMAAGFAIGALLAATPAFIAAAQSDPVKERKDNRQAVRMAVGAIKAVVDAKGDTKAIVAQAEEVVKLEQAFRTKFPAGSDKGETKALPVVWSDWPGFEAASKATEAEAQKLAMVAATGDVAKTAEQFGALGKSCGACHEKYRAK